MPKTGKPAAGAQPVTGLMGGTAKVDLCLDLTANSQATQLLGIFDHDTKNAVIVTAREASNV